MRRRQARDAMALPQTIGRKLLLSLFEQVWTQEGRIVAVQPREDFLPTSRRQAALARSAGASGVPKAGATGVGDSFGTQLRSGVSYASLPACCESLRS